MKQYERQVENKWRELAKKTHGRIINDRRGYHYLEVVKGLIEIDHGKIPQMIRTYYLSLPKSLEDRKIYLIDIESCGLFSDSQINTITLGSINGDFETETLFAFDYYGEETIMRRCFNLLRRADLVFTYNGTAFDFDRISKRLEMYALFRKGEMPDLKKMLGDRHCDLYPLVGDFLKKKGTELPDNKLQTLEKILFGVHREDEVRGADIPTIYREFVYGRKEDEFEADVITPMAKVINHNVLDVATLAATLEYLRVSGLDIDKIHQLSARQEQKKPERKETKTSYSTKPTNGLEGTLF